MKDYLHWSLRQLYLLYFWPKQFAREVEGQRSGGPKLQFKERTIYLLKMLPWIALVNIFANIVIGFTCEAFGIDYRWKESWGGVALGVLFSVAFGVALGVAFGVLFGVASGIVGGLALGVISGVALSVISGVVRAVALGVTLGAINNVEKGMAFGVLFGVALGGISATSGGVVIGIAVVLAYWFSYFRLFSYPLDAALSSVAYLNGKLRPHAIKQAWQLCPVAWNEVIWMPLPFAAKLLTMLARQDREEGLRQIAFVTAERSLQIRVALRASEELALNDLQATSIKQLADVTEKLDWTTDAPVKLSEGLVSAFPRFERTARHVDQYLTLHSEYRKGESLKQALVEVEGLQKSLVVARGRLAPRLSQTAIKWRSLLEAEQR